MNKVILIGRAGRNPEQAATKSGKMITQISLATKEVFSKDGQKQEKTTWHNCKAFGKTGEIINNYVQKGNQLVIEGKIDNYEYEKNGEKRYGSNIIIDRIEFVGGKSQTSAPDNNAKYGGTDFKLDNNAFSGTDFSADDIPF